MRVEPLQRRFWRWFDRRHPPRADAVVLGRRRLYILPSGYGYVFGLMLFVLFLWSINYNSSMGFALTFWLAAVALNVMWRTHANLLGLRIAPAGADPVFAGQQAGFRCILDNPGRDVRYGVALHAEGGAMAYADVPAHGSAALVLPLPARQRGWLRLGRLRIATVFPLGLFRAFSGLRFETRCLVYPAPAGGRPLPLTGAQTGRPGPDEQGEGSEDFAGLRPYVAGDSPRRVAWRASAGSDELLVKRFSGQARPELWLDFEALAPLPVEERLSQLCQWLLLAEQQGLDYGLRLPGRTFPPARGEQQRHRCLEALALFGLQPEAETGGPP